MQYLGGKSRIARPILDRILAVRGDRTAYVEPFLGGGSVAALAAPYFDRAILSEASEDLILLWRAILDGDPLPEEITEARWRELREDPVPSAERALAGFGCSFGGKWFAGYARDPRKTCTFAQTALRGLRKKAAGLGTATFQHVDYRDLDVPADSVLYADPPYASTTGYAATGGFDSSDFWARMEAHAERGVAVLVSEYTAPADWRPVWRSAARATLAGGTAGVVTEQLFAHPLTLERTALRDAL